MQVEIFYKVKESIESRLIPFKIIDGRGFYIGNEIVEAKPDISYEIRRVNNRIIGFLHNPFFENILIEKLTKLWNQ